MSETINGSKSSNYIKEEIPGVANSSDSFTHQSVQNLWGGRGSADVLIHAVYASQAIPFTIEAGSVRRLIKVTGHGAVNGDAVRMNNGNSDGEEIAILTVIDADFFVIAKEVNVAIGDELFIMKPVTPTYNKDGSLNVANGPVQFIKDSLVQEVTEDTVVPANNEPLPSKIFINIDGVMLPVGKDSVTPANSVLLPVEVSGVSGPINITAGDLNVQLSDLGANFDRVRIGNGTNQWDINASNEGLTHDADVLAEIVLSNASLALIQAKTDNLDVALSTRNLEATQLLIKAKTDNLDVALSTRNLEATQLLIQAKTDNLDVALSTRNLEATQLLIQAKTDNLDVALSTIAKASQLPTTIGQKAMAASTSVALASDQSAIPVTQSGTWNVGAITTFPATAATTTLQTTGNTSLGNLDTNIGAKADGVATTDIGTFSLIAHAKRNNQNITAMASKLPPALGANTAVLSLSIVPASDAKFSVKPSAIVTTYAENLALTTVTTITAPANAVSVMVMADDANANNIRVKQNATASVTSGFPIQAGRDITFDGGQDLSVISDNQGVAGASVKIYFSWKVQA